MNCPKCKGKGAMPWTYGWTEEETYTEWRECKNCKGKGVVRKSIGERTKNIKYGDVIQPVRQLAVDNSGLRQTLAAVVKKLAKTRYKRNKLASNAVKQGKYIEELKLRLKIADEHNYKNVEILKEEIRRLRAEPWCSGHH